MDNRIYLIDLFDIYGELFTDSQNKYFKSYYFDNLSLGEISENLNVSRNAVHKELKLVENKLNNYELKLGLYKKNEMIKELINSVDNEEIKQELEKISW